MIIYIYALLDPDTDEVRYVGKTKDLNKRMYSHCRIDPKPTTHKARWVNKLIAADKTPKMLVLEECSDETWEEAEIRWIAHYRSVNTNLTNISDGGKSARNAEFRKTAAYVPGLNAKLPVIKVSPLMRQEVERIAKEEDVTMGDVIREAVEAFIAKRKKAAKK